MDNIDIIFDELKRNEIDIDKQTLSFHINTILDRHRDLYRAVNARDLNLDQIYREINVTNFGCIIAYLALVYHKSLFETFFEKKPRKFWWLGAMDDEIMGTTNNTLNIGMRPVDELQKVNKSDSDYYRVEKVIRSRMRQWEVALTELHYPHTWSTLKQTQYSSIEQLTKALNAGMSKETQTKISFVGDVKFSPLKQKRS
ncbi:Hypothetical predicted protein, partial [Paramuricea clavata]